jgi:AcrR family transcriptional regulator
MTPRPYRMSRRQQAVDRRRAHMLAAARQVLRAPGSAAFSLDAVARRAGVTRLTVYHQFGSRRGLLEALFDDLAARGGLYELPSAFRHPDPEAALERYVALFGRFWTSARLVLRRLNALAVLDAALGRAIARRQEWRRQGLHVIASRLAARAARPAPEARDPVIDVLFTLTSFATFDTLAGPGRTPASVAPLVLRLARATLGLAA